MAGCDQSAARLRFRRRMRVRRKGEFSLLMQEGLRLTDERLILWVRPNGLGYTRIGLVVGKRLGGAVQRNRLRRLIRESFRLSYPRLPRGLDVACSPRHPAVDLSGVVESFLVLTSRAARRLLP